MPTMSALIYEAPKQMTVHDVPVPETKPDEVLVRIAYSGICGSELSGYLGQNELRKPPLIMGHEFSGTIEGIGEAVQAQFPNLALGQRITANPLTFCGHCRYCLSGRQNLCPKRKLMSATLPGSNAQYTAVQAQAVYVLPDNIAMTTAALTEPAACAIHAVRLARPQPNEVGLVIGAGPIGLLVVEALIASGMKTVYCTDLNAQRLAMAEKAGAKTVQIDSNGPRDLADVVFDAVGVSATRQASMAAVRSGGRVILEGLHDVRSELNINDMIRREIVTYGSFAYTPLDFGNALEALANGWLWLDEPWTRIEPLANGAHCFEELLGGSAVSKIWLTPWS
jgi:2-desacetyl-2-hydroxyethyl bacteriochlorophyllide A dehydrogenase